MEQNIRIITQNKKAYHDYFIEDTYECGIALAGTEVKSLRAGRCSIKEAFVRVENGEVYVYGMHISPYEKGNIFNEFFGCDFQQYLYHEFVKTARIPCISPRKEPFS